MKLRKISKYFIIGGVSVATFIGLFPLFWALITSIKPPGFINTVPPTLVFPATLSNYTNLFKGGVVGTGQAKQAFGENPILFYMKNSVIVAGLSTILCLFLGGLAAYSLARIRIPGTRTILSILMLSRIFPPMSGMIPLFILFSKLHLVDTYAGLIITYTAFSLPLCILLIRSFLLEVPISLEESAMIDGCSRLGAFTRVVLPLAAPGMAATSIFSFIAAWNDASIAIFLTARKATTAPVAALMSIQETGIAWGTLMAKGMIILLPAIILVAFIQKQMVRGMTMGAVKG